MVTLVELDDHDEASLERNHPLCPGFAAQGLLVASPVAPRKATVASTILF
jgi:hypothetical protein